VIEAGTELGDQRQTAVVVKAAGTDARAGQHQRVGIGDLLRRDLVALLQESKIDARVALKRPEIELGESRQSVGPDKVSAGDNVVATHAQFSHCPSIHSAVPCRGR
jgi:hypothetical protein